MAGKSPGRELAIETLIDAEPQGAFYRTSRILEEAVPAALSSRPNLVTRSALVEEAYALAEHEIDSLTKYSQVFGLEKDVNFVQEDTSSIDSLQTKRILAHHAKLQKSHKAAPPQLVSALRNVCPSDSLRTLLRKIMTHKAMEDDAEGSHLESMIANVCRMASQEKDDVVLHGVLIACLSILTGSILCTEEEEGHASAKGQGDIKKAGSKTKPGGEYLDPVMPALQVGSVLSLLQCKDDSTMTSAFQLDQEILDYLGKAAAIYEEREELKKARLDKQTPADGAAAEQADDRPLSPVPIVPLTPTANVDDEEQEEEAEQGDGDEMPTAFQREDSDSESTDDSDERYIPHANLVPQGMDDDDDDDGDIHSDDGSESSSDSEEGPQHVELVDEDDESDIDEDDDDEEDSDIEEEDAMLREALALSLVDQGPAFVAAQQAETGGNNNGGEEGGDGRGEQQDNGNEDDEQRVNANDEGNDDQQEAAQDEASESTNRVENLFETPATEASKPDEESAEEKEDEEGGDDEEELVLPPLPPAPSHYPYAILINSLSDVDLYRYETDDSSSPRERSEYLDPAEISKFGSIPSPHALVHLLRYLFLSIQQRREENKVEEKAIRSTPGGMGSSLFEPHILPFAGDSKSARTDDSDSAMTLQLLTSTFLVLDQHRRDAIENLRRAIAAEQRNLQGEEDSVDEDDSPLSAEDDPALALAMNYVEDDVYLQEDDALSATQSSHSESLENKGMRRKAAAAAHDAAARLKSLRMQTEAWRNRVKLLSLCTLMSMKCFREYIQSTVSLWLQRSSSLATNALSEPPTSVRDFEKIMPAAMIARLSDSLSCLMSVDSFRSFASLVLGDDSREIEEVFFPLQLYREALSVWGECLPMLHSSDEARFAILASTMEGYIAGSATGVITSDPDSLEALPLLESEVQLHKLRILCRRFCVSDLLDGLVSRPIYYSTEDITTKIGLFVDDDAASAEPRLFSKLIKIVGSVAGSCPQQARGDIQRLYFALCHRFNVQVLLWDGLYASTDFELDGIASSPSTTGSAGAVVRVGPNPSTNLQFDPSKCSDSIAILSSDSPPSAGGPSAHQRASKVWGSVLSSSYYSPKTGIHRWAVRLDKCERGHVFVGVATSQASTRTYVGGDKFGWGAIGTQALWHDRRKIRGDYGATFRTGCTIIVTLDTDAGTLSFSTWKDSSNSSASFSLDPSLQSGSSPTRRTAGGGTIEDWGVAFEGLPLDSRLYPAVGLYQRDDRVTLLNVESGQLSGRDGVIDGKLAGGHCYYPGIPDFLTESKPDTSRVAQVKRHNDVLSWDGIQYVTEVLRSLSDNLGAFGDEQPGLLYSVLPSITAALNLLPSSIPMLSKRFGVVILPHLSRCIHELHSVVKAQHDLFRNGLQEGKWTIRATGSSGAGGSTDYEEYVVDFTKTTKAGESMSGFHGSGIGTTGKSKNGLVSIVGTTYGSAVHFVEEWTDENEEIGSTADSTTSSCAITARMNVEGSKFEGSYKNVQYGTFGQISGFLVAPSLQKKEERRRLQDIALKCEALLSLAQGHLAGILAEGVAGDQNCRADTYRPALFDREQWQRHCTVLKGWARAPLLSRGLIDHDRQVLSRELNDLRQLYAPPDSDVQSGALEEGILGSDILAGIVFSGNEYPRCDLESAVDKIDDMMTSRTGGKGSLAMLCPLEYSSARKNVICALGYHVNLYEAIIQLSKQPESVNAASDDIITVWRSSLRIVEDCVRRTISSSQELEQSRKDVAIATCENLDRTSNFLMDVALNDVSRASSVITKAEDIASFYSTVRSEDDLTYIMAEMTSSTKKALLRMIATKEIAQVLQKIQNSNDLVASEGIVAIIPRLMGPSWTKLRRGQRDDLGGYYLTELAGATELPTVELRAAVASIYDVLSSLLQRHLKRQANEIEDSSKDSLIQSILAAFIVSIRAADVSPVLSKSSIFEQLSAILDSNRDAILTSEVAFDSDSDRASAIREIQEIVKRDSSRSVLRSATSIAHVMCFQLSQFVADRSQVYKGNDVLGTMLRECLELSIGELGLLGSLIESMARKEMNQHSKRLVSDDWESWCGACLPGGYRSTTSENASNLGLCTAGIEYLNDHGVGQVVLGSQPGSQTSSPSSESKAAARSDRSAGMLAFCCQEYLTKWLHILSCISKSPTALEMVANSSTLTDVLLTAIGISCERNAEGILTATRVSSGDECTLLPARYRSRILRLMRGLLVITAPSEVLVEGLLCLAGISTTISSESSDSDDCLVARETISLLRYLHLPAFPSWRESVLRIVSARTGVPGPQNSTDMSLGIRLFLGGSINALDRGAYVLLKPPAAQPLSPDAQASPSSKSHSASGNSVPPLGMGVSPHHVAGNGTEGIVSGLCRVDAAAGIVSSVLAKNGVCEVILMNRTVLPSSENVSLFTPDGGSRNDSVSSDKRSISSRLSLTVRALRTPLADVALAEEIPLFLDSSFDPTALLGASLLPSLDVLKRGVLVSSPDNTGETGSVEDVHADTVDQSPAFALATLRSAIAIMSNKELLDCFLKNEEFASDSLGQVLALACDSDASQQEKEFLRSTNLSDLPKHEAQFMHLTAMLREIAVRREVIEKIPISFWEKKLADQRKIRESASTERGADIPTDSAEGSGVAPPSGAAPESDSRDSSTGTAQRGLGDDEVRRGESTRMVSQSTVSTNNSTDEDDDGEAAATAAAHLREAAIAQMAELGLPRSWSELALRRTGGTNIEAAVHFCLERGGDMERLIAEEQERERMMERQSSGSSSSRRRSSRADNTNHLLSQLLEMGFPRRWCAEALAATGNNVDEALTWILTNGERLSAEDMGMEEDMDDVDEDIDDDDDSGEDDEEDDTARTVSEPGTNEEDIGAEAASRQGDAGADTTSASALAVGVGTDLASDKVETEKCGWSGSVCPLRFISGRSIINSKSLSVSGLPSGGFSSVGTKGVLLTSGKWYYEAVLETAGCLQIGWADGSFSGHCNADRGDGCGDGPSSWAFDGWRRYRWHSSATEWGCRWKEGDIIGCLVDLDDSLMSFTLNGQAEEVGMGIAFSGEGFRPCGGVYACVSFNRREKLRIILGGENSEPFKHQPPPGYKGVGEAVLSAVAERDELLSKEAILDLSNKNATEDSKRYLCDFSDGEHGHELFAWQHRYYGSDASVHLGSSRHLKNTSESQKGGSEAPFTSEASALLSVSRRLQNEWKKNGVTTIDELNGVDNALDTVEFVSRVKKGFENVSEQLEKELKTESVTLGILYCRKLVLHLMVTLGSAFELHNFIPRSKGDDYVSQLTAARNIWSILDTCASLRSSGWVGEAGAMAVAAEALGLGISSAQSRHGSADMRTGLLSTGQADDSITLPAAGISQILSSVLSSTSDTRTTTSSLAACAEAAIGTSGSLVFLQPSLQSLVARSSLFQDIIVAVVRRSVRLLAVVDYSGEDSTEDENSEDDDMDGPSSTFDGPSRSPGKESDDELSGADQPDARLTLFLTGLMLSRTTALTSDREEHIMESLFEAWSVGLLSASAPWRMVCAISAAGILNIFPKAVLRAIESVPTISRFYARLHSTVARRIWAERAAVPVCSRYSQALTELLSSFHCALQIVHPSPSSFCEPIWVDAATPRPFDGMRVLTEEPLRSKSVPVADSSWEWDDGWLASDAGWEVWTGSVKCMAVDWKAPSRSAVRTLMDGGEGPPMLRVGCKVMRGLDWDEKGSGSINGNDDGKDEYDVEKANRDKEKRSREEDQVSQTAAPQSDPQNESEVAVSSDPTADMPALEPANRPPSPEDDAAEPVTSPSPATDEKKADDKKQKRRKLPSPKLPLGTVLSIESWKGMPAMSRRVKWDRTGVEGIYRFGGDGGRYDISHVEVNKKSTRVRKRHPYPESAEQCAFRHGFGVEREHSVLLRLRRSGKEHIIDGEVENHRQGILEWPGFGAAIRVDCILHADGAVTLTEKDLLYGSKDSGWEARFGQPSYVPGTVMVLTPTGSLENQSELDATSSFLSLYEELLGSSSFAVEALRDRANGNKIRVTSEMRLLRTRRTESDTVLPSLAPLAPGPPPMRFDSKLHAPSISLSRDGRTITCIAPDGRGTAYASTGFTKGVHYWEVKLEQADIGSIFIGVAEKPSSGGSGGSPFGQETQPRLNRWHGWGFVNFRATYTAGAERVYGAHCHAGDTVGVLLDCDAGRVSFFFDGLKYGEHILNDLGCAFENLSPFGFNADGCGSGGAGQGAPSGVEGGRGGRYPAQGAVRPRALWPVIGLRNPGDRVTMSTKWMTSLGIDGPVALKNILAVDELLVSYDKMDSSDQASVDLFPNWFVDEAFSEYERWRSGRWLRSVTRGSGPHRMASFGLDVDLDTSPLACASACACLGLKRVLLPGDRVMVKRSAGRMLELPEEAIILGAYQGRLYYRIVSQKSEGGSLTEGGGRAWFWDESEVVDDGIEVIGKGKGMDISLPTLHRFTCRSEGGLKVVYEGGAVVRSDLEIFDGSVNIGSVSLGTVIPQKDVLERRVNSCGVVRYRIRHGDISNGWISAWIRGGREEAIVEPLLQKEAVGDDEEDSVEDYIPCSSFATPLECAQAWYSEFSKRVFGSNNGDEWTTKDIDEFKSLLSRGLISGMSTVESDMLLVSAVGAIADFSESGDAVDCSFDDIAGPLVLAVSSSNGTPSELLTTGTSSGPGANQAALRILANLNVHLPDAKALLARAAMLRALNRRARWALPWLSVRPSQEGNAIFGGLSGHGASIDRVGQYRQPASLGEWVQVPSIGSRVRAFRRLFFTCIKRSFLENIMDCTTTPTPLSHDEYELPREIRTVRINRLKARRAMAGSDIRAKRKHSAFSQLQSETRSWGGAALRRGFVAKGHGGQKRAFKVKLIGEGVNDYSGPYREAFTDAIQEISEADENGNGDLGVLDATPNNASQIGDNRELFMFSTGGRDLTNANSAVGVATKEEERIRSIFASLTMTRDETSREVEESLVFLGRLVGTACRHGIPVDLPLPMHTVWKAIAEETSDPIECLKEIDLLASRQLDVDSNERPMILQWQQRMLNSFMDGLSNVFPDEILTLMTGQEIRDVLCGNSDIDVDLLRRVVEYEGYDEEDEVIQYFWEALREMDSNERKKFLQFVWARNRLPTKESAFDAPFKIQKDTASAGGSADAALPSASTCFFSLTLPEYSNKEILKRKLLFAIENVVTMESDYVTNEAELGEGWRGV